MFNEFRVNGTCVAEGQAALSLPVELWRVQGQNLLPRHLCLSQQFEAT